MVGGRGERRDGGKEGREEGWWERGREKGWWEGEVAYGEKGKRKKGAKEETVWYVLGMSFSEILSHLFQSSLPLLCPVPLTGLPLLPAGCVGERRSGLAMEADTVLTSVSSSCL